MVGFLHILFGFIASFVGMLIPSMLNITAVKISIQKGKMEAIKFSIAVSLVVLVQAFLAVVLTKNLNDNPAYFKLFEKVAVVILMTLSFYFFYQSKKDRIKITSSKEKGGYSFITGIGLSILNMFAIPFYYGVTTSLNMAGWLQLSTFNIVFFAVGAAFGSFILLLSYTYFAEIAHTKTKGLTQNMNLKLSLITGVLALVTVFQLF